MNFTEIQCVLEKWFLDISGLPQVVWDNQPRPKTVEPFGVIRVRNSVSVGIDETRYDDNGAAIPAPNLDPSQVGLRRFLVQLVVESRSHVPAKAARWYLERARTRLRRPSSLARLSAGGMALIRTDALVNLDREIDGRMVSSASLDVTLHATSTCADEPIESIETVRITSNVADVDGSALPVSLTAEKEIAL